LTPEEKFGTEGLAFDDVLLIPARSDILPAQVSTRTLLTRELALDIPIISAAMDTVTEARMAIALARLGGLGVLHRNLTVDAQSAQVKECKAAGVRVGAAVGVSGDSDERVSALVAAGVDLLVIDVAHGHSASVIRMVEKIKTRHRVQVIAGNVVTASGTEELIAAGADGVKIGVGPGAICTTRVVAGAGMPQVTAIFDCANAAARHVIATNEGSFKRYRGMGSMGAMAVRKAGDRYGQGEVSEFSKIVPEGVEGQVRAVGALEPFIHQLVGGLRAGMKYVGAASIEDLRTKARFVRISGAGLRESHPHDVQITVDAPNYRVRTSG
jgi:IMP dehydrogenase